MCVVPDSLYLLPVSEYACVEGRECIAMLIYVLAQQKYVFLVLAIGIIEFLIGKGRVEFIDVLWLFKYFPQREQLEHSQEVCKLMIVGCGLMGPRGHFVLQNRLHVRGRDLLVDLLSAA